MRLFRLLSIKLKLFVLVAFLSICIAAIGFIGYINLKDSTARMHEMYNQRLIPIQQLSEVRVHSRAIEANILELLAVNTPSQARDTLGDIEVRDEAINVLLDNLKNSLPEEKLAVLTTEMDEFMKQRSQVINFATNGKLKDSLLLYATFGSLLDQINQHLTDLTKEQTLLAEQSDLKNQNEADKAYTFLLASIIACVAFAMTVGYILSRLITVPISRVVQVANKVAQGDLSVEQLDARGKDEVSQLSHTMNEMVDHLKELIQEVGHSANLVTASASELMIGSEHTSEATKAAASAVQDIHEGFRKQLLSIHETNRAMEEMVAGIGQIATGSEEVSSASGIAYEKAKAGKEVIANTVSTIQNLAVAVHDSSRRIELLGEKTKEIDAVVELISTMATQTNLLSLNASIEAARAGEHGRGFGVVAGEVKKLAEESHAAADKVSDLIGQIQSETMLLVSQITASARQAEDGLQAAQAAGSTFDEIARGVEGVSQQIVSVSATVEEMSAGSQEILASSQSLLHIAETSAAHTESVTATTQETLASMQQVRNSSAGLSDLAAELGHLISKFKIQSENI